MSETRPRAYTFVQQLLKPDLEARGYEVFVQPRNEFLPPVLQGTRPDAIALKSDHKIVIGVLPAVDEPNVKIPRLQAALAGHPDWELRLYSPEEGVEKLTLPVMPREAIQTQSARLLDIHDAAGPVPALLTGWALLESAARLLMPKVFSRRQTPESLMENLAFEGWVTPDEAAMLRPLGRMWNRAAHGDLSATVTRQEIETLAEVIRTLLGLVGIATETEVESPA